MKNIKNKRVFLKEGKSAKTHDASQKDNLRKYLREAPEDDSEELDLGDDAETNDSLGDLDVNDNAQVEAWVDELLNTTLEDELDNDSEIDLEDDADILDSGKSLRAKDVPLSGDDMEDIIDADDSLEVLANELQDLSIDDETDEELEDVSDELEEAVLQEAIANLEKIATPTSTKSVKFKAGKTIRAKRPTVTKKGDKEIVNLEDDFVEDDKIAPTEKKIADTNDKNIAKAHSKDLKVAKLTLENYKLSRANMLLVVASDNLNEKSRTSLVEGFNRCKDKEAVDNFYKTVVNVLKESAQRGEKKKALRESVVNSKKGVKVLKESKNTTKQEPKISLKQQRINHLMGIKTDTDMYNF